MIKTFFYLKTDKQNNKGESPIYAKIQLQGKTTTLSTGKYICKERWNFTNKLRNKLRLSTEKNCKLAIDLVESKIEDAFLELSRTNKNNIQAMDIICSARKDGKTFQSIADKLNKLQYTTRRGKQFNPIQVKRLYEKCE